jgi:hypothetical protein
LPNPQQRHHTKYHHEYRRQLQHGKSANVIASTTTFSVGELNIAASTDSVLIPEAKALPIGATQFAHTPSGIPAAAPKLQ